MTRRDLNVLAPPSALARLGSRPVGRRNLFRGVAAAGLAGLGASALSACGGSSAGLVKGGPTAPPRGPVGHKLNMYSWGDYDEPAVLKAFQNRHDLSLHVDAYGSNEELIAKLAAARATGGYDIVVPTGAFVTEMGEHGLLQKLDLGRLPNFSHLDPHFTHQVWDPHNTYSVCKNWGTTGYVYDKSVIKRPLRTWGDFLDAASKEAAGKVCVLDDPTDVTGIYYWANDIDWNTTDKRHNEACRTYLVGHLAKQIRNFDSYPGTSGAISSLQYPLIQVWNGDARQGILSCKEPERWQWVLPGPKTEIWMDNWSIAAGAPHTDAAYAFIDYVLAPKNSLDELNYIGYHTGVKGMEAAARKAEFEMLDLIFFSDDELSQMVGGTLNAAQEVNVDTYNRVRAAAGN